MRRLVLFLAALAAFAPYPFAWAATTWPVNSGQSQATIQGIINGSSVGDTVAFAAGAYSVTSAYALKCGVTYTGPVATPATAKITTTTANIFLTQLTGACSSPTTIEYLQLDGAGALSVDGSNHSNISFLHNQTTKQPSLESCTSCEGIYFNGTSNQTLANITFEYNSFGDVNSCTAAISAFVSSPHNVGGDCIGILVNSANAPQTISNFVIKYNTFYHLLEGVHWTPYSAYKTGNPGSVSQVDIEYNYAVGNHRMNFVEFQTGLADATTSYISNNVVLDPSPVSSGWEYDFAFSMPCCQWGATMGTGTTGTIHADNNIIIDDRTPSATSVTSWGFEAGGIGTYSNNLIQGAVCEAFVYTWGPPAINNNTMQGSLMSSGAHPPGYTPETCGYIHNEISGAQALRSQTGNVQGATPTAITSFAPTISPGAGAQTYPLSVSMSDTGYTSGAQPLGNTSIYYTTDGTTPVPGSGTTKLYSGAFFLNAAATVKAVGMWGTPPQPTSYASGFGFVPSSVISAAYTGGGTRTVTSVTLTPAASAIAMHVGATNQAAASCHYSDGSNDNCVASSHAVTWASGTPGTATISSSGLITAVANGTTNLTATAAGITSANVLMTVSTLSSITIASAGGASLHVAATSQFTAACIYANGFSDGCNTVDLYGYTAAWTSGTPATGTISSPGGLFTAVAAGTSAVHASAGGVNSANTTMTIIGPTLSSINLSLTGSGSGSPASYFISPSGSDSNNGLSTGAPWLTPLHPLNCGDTITAASGTYSASNFGNGKWGAVNCPAGNNVAWLKCATFDGCKITATASDGMWVDQSYWGVQGWETSVNTYVYGACFHAGPSGTASVHHIIFANDVANGCMGGGFNAYDASTSASVDYIAYIGDVTYNGAQGTGACYSGFNIYQPIASDTNPGTHMYVAGNFSYDNVDGNPCAGSAPTDGEGINLDTFDFSQGGGTAYIQQAVVQNNISASNGSAGILVENNKTGATAAPIYFKNNTTYGDMTDPNRTFCVGLGELYAQAAFNVTMIANLAMTNAATGCSSDAIYAVSIANDNISDSVAGNWLYSSAGNTAFLNASGTFAYGSNITGLSPAFTSTTVPGAPSCSGAVNVPNCMATLISNFTPTASGSTAYGYQAPTSTSIVDPLYPQWLCTTTNIPSGLVTPGCGQTIQVSQTIQLTAICAYSDGSTANCTATATYASSVTADATVNASGLVTGVAAGSTNLSAVIGAVTSNTVVLNVTAALGTFSRAALTNTGLVNTMGVGATAQFFAICTYSDNSTDDCTRAGGVTLWTTNNAPVMTMGAAGLATGVTAGSANAQAQIGSVHYSDPWTMTITAAPALTSVTSAMFGGVGSIPLGANVQMIVTCGYSDGTFDTCSGAADPHGNLAGSYRTSSAGVATIDSNGLVTPVAVGSVVLGTTVGTSNANLGLTVTTPLGAGILGGNQQDLSGTIHANNVNLTYAVTPSTGGPYTVGSCHLFISNAVSVTTGKHFDCGIIPATSGTTMASSATCWGTYTNPSTTAPNAFVAITPSGCPTLPANTAYWVFASTDDPAVPNIGYYDCGGSCAGGVPTVNNGTYPFRYEPVTYGTYTGLPSSTNAVTGGAATHQMAIYFDILPPAATLASAFQSNAGAVNQLTLYSTLPPIQQRVTCVYSDAVRLDCTFGDSRGSAVTAWSASFNILVGAVGSSGPGLIVPWDEGTGASSCTVTGGIPCSPYTWTVIAPVQKYMQAPGMTMSGITTH